MPEIGAEIMSSDNQEGLPKPSEPKNQASELRNGLAGDKSVEKVLELVRKQHPASQALSEHQEITGEQKEVTAQQVNHAKDTGVATDVEGRVSADSAEDQTTEEGAKATDDQSTEAQMHQKEIELNRQAAQRNYLEFKEALHALYEKIRDRYPELSEAEFRVDPPTDEGIINWHLPDANEYPDILSEWQGIHDKIVSGTRTQVVEGLKASTAQAQGNVELAPEGRPSLIVIPGSKQSVEPTVQPQSSSDSDLKAA